jgi:hypothetical protein
MASALTIDGTLIDRDQFILVSATLYGRGEQPSLRFLQRGGPLSGFSNWANKSVLLEQDGTAIFAGDTTSYTDRFDGTYGWVREWTAIGLINRANRVPVTDSMSLTDTITYNLRVEDGADYIPSRAGRTVAQIVQDVLEMVANATALNAKGIGGYSGLPSAPALSATTLSDIAGMTIVPPQRVTISGERILQSLESFVQIYYPNTFNHLDPDGTIRFHDPRTWSADITLTLDGSDARVGKPTLTREWGSCSSRVVVRGDQQVRGLTFGLVPWPGSTATDGGATESFSHDGLSNTDAKSKFTAADWNQPGQSWGQASATASLSTGAVNSFTVTNQGYGYTSAPSVLITGGGGSGATGTAVLTGDKVTSITKTAGGSGYTTAPTVTLTAPGVGQSVIGTCTMPDTLTVTITPSDGKVQWPTDYWDQTSSGHQGYVVLYSNSVTGIEQLWPARIVSCTSLSPGGTCDLTIDAAAPSTAYDSFQLYGQGGGNGVVWRRYAIASPFGSLIQQSFPYEVPFRRGSELSETLVSTPQATVFFSTSGNPPYQVSSVGISAIDPDAGTVTLTKPSALVFSPNGTTIVPPNDVQFFLPIAVGTLEVVYPADLAGVPQYAGTSFSVEGVEETKYVTCKEWRDGSNSANMLAWAQEIHGSMSDTVVEGDATYLGLLTDALLPGHAINLPGEGYTSGWESIDIPIARCGLEFNDGKAAVPVTTSVHLSNRRMPYSGEAFFRPSQVGLPVGLMSGFFSFSSAAAEEGIAASNQVAGEALDRGVSDYGYDSTPVTSAAPPDSGFTFADTLAAGQDNGAGIRDRDSAPRGKYGDSRPPLPASQKFDRQGLDDYIAEQLEQMGDEA